MLSISFCKKDGRLLVRGLVNFLGKAKLKHVSKSKKECHQTAFQKPSANGMLDNNKSDCTSKLPVYVLSTPAQQPAVQAAKVFVQYTESPQKVCKSC